MLNADINKLASMKQYQISHWLCYYVLLRLNSSFSAFVFIYPTLILRQVKCKYATSIESD